MKVEIITKHGVDLLIIAGSEIAIPSVAAGVIKHQQKKLKELRSLLLESRDLIDDELADWGGGGGNVITNFIEKIEKALKEEN